MIEAITYALIGAVTATAATWLIVRPKLIRLRELTDRNDLGQFAKLPRPSWWQRIKEIVR